MAVTFCDLSRYVNMNTSCLLYAPYVVLDHFEINLNDTVGCCIDEQWTVDTYSEEDAAVVWLHVPTLPPKHVFPSG